MIISAGEACPVEVALRWAKDRVLINGYGPTETTVAASWHEVNHLPPGMTRVPIGRPLHNTRVYVLDAWGHPLPVGIPGELHVGGKSLALGYLNLPELTAAKFIPYPFPPTRSIVCTRPVTLFAIFRTATWISSGASTSR